MSSKLTDTSSMAQMEEEKRLLLGPTQTMTVPTRLSSVILSWGIPIIVKKFLGSIN